MIPKTRNPQWRNRIQLSNFFSTFFTVHTGWNLLLQIHDLQFLKSLVQNKLNTLRTFANPRDQQTLSRVLTPHHIQLQACNEVSSGGEKRSSLASASRLPFPNRVGINEMTSTPQSKAKSIDRLAQ